MDQKNRIAMRDYINFTRDAKHSGDHVAALQAAHRDADGVSAETGVPAHEIRAWVTYQLEERGAKST